MRRASIEEITHFTREQEAESLGVSVNYLRTLCQDLRGVLSPEEFDFQPNDGMISADAASKLIEYKNRARTLTRERILNDIKLRGL